MTKQQKELLTALENGEVFTFLSNEGGNLSHKDLFVLAFELDYQASENMTKEERKRFESNIAKELKERYF